MSTVFLHVGQCGNQTGRSFWKTVIKDQSVNDSHTFVDHNGIQRSVHVDSEPKVIWSLTRSMNVREKNVCAGKRGRGSNWALGYHGVQSTGDDHLTDDAMECLRKEVERCDHHMGVVLMHSLSGGTGSGLGSRLCELIREEYPMNYLMSCAIAPCVSGESPLQHYNSLLTLSHLHRYTDGVVLMHNDEILRKLQKRNEKSVSFSAMNQSIANSLCGVFLPTESLTPSSGFSTGMEPWDMVRTLCPMPSLKFIHILQHARSKVGWDGLATQTLHSLQRYNTHGKPFKSVANLVVGRGDSSQSFLAAMKRGVEDKIKSSYSCVAWNPMPVDYWSARRNALGPRDSSSITIAANYGSVVDYLETVLERSKVMFEAGAYLHWYDRYGVSTDTFEAAFETLSAVIDDYKAALS
ncbi:tubulin delta chain-like [Haliotis cracherodii]|uniref:tubulin delta chain-like n=1 Tax=Haliotis cracherodii TaxID=6455 RepID=UPI0039E861EF